VPNLFAKLRIGGGFIFQLQKMSLAVLAADWFMAAESSARSRETSSKNSTTSLPALDVVFARYPRE
jgi:hypothetical protein